MNKKQLIDAMGQHSGLTKKQCSAALTAMLGAISRSLHEGDAVFIPKFGNFSLSYHPTKIGRNPQTGEQIEIAGQNKVAFKCAKALKDRLHA
ncbi:HU family DNA-binding protein [Pseudoalteromonas sp. T1lg48]|uniref:HU family DNA-binding protein n=1 Tax=Pseudoalteromonas sp. T1lg48 TaxID=2077100 RepID=UPI000CF744FC|nr:HU family DNA-binding protein [Pseudoalteromonas sp. T1lg48]